MNDERVRYAALTSNENCDRLAKRRNPDGDAKCALRVSIQGPSLAAGDSNALGIGDCACAEPILQGSALAFLTLGTPFEQKKANLDEPERERRRLACWSPVENTQTTQQEYFFFVVCLPGQITSYFV